MAEVTYYYNTRATGNWANPDYMIDGILTNYASTATDATFENLNGNTCPGTDLGTITKVELRAYGYGDGDDTIAFYLLGPTPDRVVTMPSSPNWSVYADITADKTWTWANIGGGAFVKFLKAAKGNTMHCAKVEIRVTYTPGGGPTPNAYNKILYTEEPPTPNAWNQVKQDTGTGWRKLLYT